MHFDIRRNGAIPLTYRITKEHRQFIGDGYREETAKGKVWVAEESMEGNLVDLGFATAKVPHGSHICQIYSDDEERFTALLKFVETGLKRREATACFSVNLDTDTMTDWLLRSNVDLVAERQQGHLTLADSESTYFENDRFDPDRILSLLTRFHEMSLTTGRSGARAIGEMSPNILKIRDGSRLFEYEARVNGLLKEHPVTAVCQYDARRFDGATIMDVLIVHPFMVVRGNVIQNPFFELPDAFASR